MVTVALDVDLLDSDSVAAIYQINTLRTPDGDVVTACRQLASGSPQLLDRIRSDHRVLVLPHMNYHPAQYVKLLVFLPVSGHVSLKLLSPPLAVVLRKDAMLRARMPETTIHENRYQSRSEHEIWTARQQCKIYSVSKATAMQLVTYKHLRCSGGSAHLLHLRRNSPIQGDGPFSSRMISQAPIFLSLRDTVRCVGHDLVSLPGYAGLAWSGWWRGGHGGRFRRRGGGRGWTCRE
jgi:hypothetical protein